MGFSVACGSSDTSGNASSGNGGGGTGSSSGAGGSGAGGSGGGGSGFSGSGDQAGSGNSGGSGSTSSGAGGSGTSSGAGGSGTSSGAGGSGTSSGTGGSGAGDGGGPPANKPPCVTKATEGAFVGDSYITGALSPALQASLDPILMMAGQVTGYTNKAVAGTAMAAGGIGLIPPQYDSLVGTDVRLVILDGGGNDILIPATGSPGTNCKNMAGNSMTKACQDIISAALAAGATLMQKMADNGVKDVIFFGYPHVPPSTLGGTNGNELIDYATPLTKASCDGELMATGGKLTCHFIDLRTPFGNSGVAGTPNIGGDNVHPTAAGQAIIAGEIEKVMKASCLGQPVSSGCCTP
jgi:lysophospholipase L1-like esterase